jgi:hypothetical protein
VTLALAVAVLLLLLLVVLWALGGEHGPGRHLSSPAWQSEPDVLVSVDG